MSLIGIIASDTVNGRAGGGGGGAGGVLSASGFAVSTGVDTYDYYWRRWKRAG
jgi:hypothetical protein